MFPRPIATIVPFISFFYSNVNRCLTDDAARVVDFLNGVYSKDNGHKVIFIIARSNCDKLILFIPGNLKGVNQLHPNNSVLYSKNAHNFLSGIACRPFNMSRLFQ